MKAVILAGGEGARLRPISLGRPKVMTPLLGKPVLEHLLQLLQRHGVSDICIALGRGDGTVREYFGDGNAFGVHLTYRVEEVPLGTAGSVKNCADFIGGGDVLVLGGDSVCDLDLTAAMEFHQERDALATLLICRHPRPLEYGMVLTDDRGRVELRPAGSAWHPPRILLCRR